MLGHKATRSTFVEPAFDPIVMGWPLKYRQIGRSSTQGIIQGKLEYGAVAAVFEFCAIS
jgi:hypothetical protein